jgi:hypothetical protein
MTDEQINAAIAEACGWRKEDGVWMWKSNEIDWTSYELRDYCNDLNAMHEAECLYIEMDEWWSAYLRHIGTQWSKQHAAHAPARQRAEAFLRTLGKWEDA